MRGVRVQSVVQELRGEKIDIVQWSDDPATFVGNALSPAKIYKINANPDGRAMEVIVEDDQLSLAIGKKGQNVRLAAKLTKWRLDIKSRSEYEQGLRTTAEGALAGLTAASGVVGGMVEAVEDVDTPTPADLGALLVESEPEPTATPDRMVDATMDGGTHELER
jgi:transcription termination/antitermination protein NusA